MIVPKTRMHPTTMSVEIQREAATAETPPDPELRRAASAALEGVAPVQVCVRIVDEAEGRALNRHWRGRDRATNVLSFAAAAPPGLPDDQVPALIGDIVLCAPVIEREAAEQGKTAAAHWAHLIVHGILHLRGFDHTEADEAARMEGRETVILAGLGIADPYRGDRAA